MLTLFLSRADVSRHARALHLLQEFRKALSTRHDFVTETVVDPKISPRGETVSIRCAAATGIPAYLVTSRPAPGGDNGPSQAIAHLHAVSSHRLLAVMNAGHLTTLRTSLVGALATDILARPDARNIAVLGQGTHASGALKALRLVRSLERVWLYEADLVANTELAFRLQSSIATSVRGTDSAAEAVATADIVVLTGGAVLEIDSLPPGTHVSVLNADGYPQNPVSAQILSSARCLSDGSGGQPSWMRSFSTTLADVLQGRGAGRTSADEVTFFAAAGQPFLDLVAAWHVYEGAKTDETITRLDLES